MTDAQWQITTLRSALENWGQHHSWCAAIRSAPAACSCGLADALAVNTANTVSGANTVVDDAMVERSARAMYEATGWPASWQSLPVQDMYRDAARRALTAALLVTP